MKVGDELDLIVEKVMDQDGVIQLSRKKLASRKGMEEIAKAAESDVYKRQVLCAAASVHNGGCFVVQEGLGVCGVIESSAAHAGVRRRAKAEVIPAVPVDAVSYTHLDEMVQKYLDGAEVVYGVRSRRDTDTFFKRFTACLLYTSAQSPPCWRPMIKKPSGSWGGK